MTTETIDTCPHCGEPERDETEHRACRLKAAFPGSYSQDGAFVSFDLSEISAAIGWERPVETRSGLRIERTPSNIWISVETRVGNSTSAWSWRISEDEWTAIVAAIPVKSA